MKFKKSVVFALSISALALSASGIASAKETKSSPVTEVKSASMLPSHVIKIQDRNLTISVGDQAWITNLAATRYVSDNTAVASVDQGGLVTAKAIGTATITLFKGDSVLGKVFVQVI
ncbi:MULTISPECIES: Ig-like domain-containing protein [Bacillus]|uniref:BIG2 domain-containing protein n=2 Tax=Bacillus sonorensis TaxID=119858 RepID=M5P3Y0_9BACI|nr:MULTISPECIES: Ig-like domain-containing protein [Bacillus]ASB89489.1 uncharacterized protein S101395_02982 [Bacillus sonorensis]EME74163.1 hypothetical protein BSONL12_10256 [Bacillus sonorensis L12]MCF7618764.1 Ig-like domain-containing protein [Bacillus sonorensis]MCY7855119.1 Ig-like domain-containing protein [Bacillus sonorensis]MCY8024591.1 Ig-like domain-containing protein [Bacillus sonorensis]